MRMPRPPPPAAALISSGKPSGAGLGEKFAGVETFGRRRGDRKSRARDELARADLVAKQADDVGGRTDETKPCALDRGGEIGIFGEKPVSGMDRFGAGRSGGGDDRLDVEVGGDRRRRGNLDGLVGLAHGKAFGVRCVVDDDARYTECAQRADDPHRDLTPVGDQELLHADCGAQSRELSVTDRSRCFALRRRPM